MIAGLSVIGFVIPSITIWYLNNRYAKRKCDQINKLITNDKDFENIVSEIITNKKYDLSNPRFGADVRLYLVEYNGEINLIPISNTISQTMLKSEYDKIIKKMKGNQLTYKSYLETASVFFRYSPPYENTLLRIDYPNKGIFLK